jgi:hypothetical protein
MMLTLLLLPLLPLLVVLVLLLSAPTMPPTPVAAPNPAITAVVDGTTKAAASDSRTSNGESGWWRVAWK